MLDYRKLTKEIFLAWVIRQQLRQMQISLSHNLIFAEHSTGHAQG